MELSYQEKAGSEGHDFTEYEVFKEKQSCNMCFYFPSSFTIFKFISKEIIPWVKF